MNLSEAPLERRPRVLVVGCGAIGGTLAGALVEHDAEVVEAVLALSTNTAIAEAVNRDGFVLRGVGGERALPGTVLTRLDDRHAPFDWIFLATQPPQVEAAAREVLPWLAPEGALVCLQNGLCEARLAAIAGEDRVVGAIVGWGASMAAPGVYERTSEGGFTLGSPGRPHPRLDELALLLEIAGAVSRTDNLVGARWSKLAINCCISTLGTIGGDRLGALMRHRFVRRLGLEIMTEAVEVARAEGVRLEKISGTLDLDWMALPEEDRRARASAGLVARHTLLLAVGARYRRLRSSMLAAIERGRPPAVDFLNGEVVQRGLLHGVPTPVNHAATARVHAIAAGQAKSDLDSLRALAAEVGVAV